MNGLSRRRLLLLSLLPSAVLALLLVIYFTYGDEQILETQLRQHGVDLVRHLAPVSEYGVLSGDIGSLQELTQNATQQSAVKAALIVDRDGRVLAVSGRVSLSADILRQALAAPAAVAKNGQWIGFGAPIVRSVIEFDDVFNRQDQRISSAASDAIGSVFVEIDVREAFGSQRTLLLKSLLIIFAGLALTAFLVLHQAKRVKAVLTSLSSSFTRLGEKHFQTTAPPLSENVFGELAQSFNAMTRRLETEHRAMKLRVEEVTANFAYLARHDALTNLINRREFKSRLEIAITAMASGGIEICVLFLDLDRFKRINDSAGHLAGDELLRQLSRLFQGRLRDKDALARISDDKFGIILIDCDLDNARQLAKDLCQLSANYRFLWQDNIFRGDVSIGLVHLEQRMRHVTDILDAGGTACNTAKASGRNQMHEHAPSETPAPIASSDRWRTRIEHALHENFLRCAAMPTFPLKANTTDILLADLRVSVDDRQISPLLFMDMAERCNLAQAVDDLTLTQTLSLLQKAQAQTPSRPLCLILPLSASSLRAKDSAAHIIELLRRHHYAGRGLCISLREEAVIRNISEAGVLCAALRQQGCQIALTDFGGWQPSFNHLDVTRPDFIRISRSLSLDLQRHHSAKTLVRAMQEIAIDRGILTIVDGVDSNDMLETLRELGVDFVEGAAVSLQTPLDIWIQGVSLAPSSTANGPNQSSNLR